MRERLTYEHVGASAAPDLLEHPPRGYRPLERRALIGHGQRFFAQSVGAVMGWRIQSLSGFRVESTGDPNRLVLDDEATLAIRFGPLWIKSPARVVYVVDEPRRGGFAYGTLPGHPESGEEAFIVEHHDDDSVWVVIRAFSRPSRWYWRVGSPALRLTQSFYTRRYLRVLAAGRG